MKYPQNTGFTLIELIVVITIMATLSTVGIASFVNFGRTQSLNDATANFVTIVQLAKASATSQVKPVTCDPGTLDGYAVTIVPSVQYTAEANSYSVAPVCGGTIDTVAQKDYTLPVNLRFYPVSELTILFHVISGDVTFSPANQNGYTDIMVQNGQVISDTDPTPPQNGLKVVRIYSDGRIDIQ